MCILANTFVKVGVGIINCQPNRKQDVPSPAIKAASVSLVPLSLTAHKQRCAGITLPSAFLFRLAVFFILVTCVCRQHCEVLGRGRIMLSKGSRGWESLTAGGRRLRWQSEDVRVAGLQGLCLGSKHTDSTSGSLPLPISRRRG